MPRPELPFYPAQLSPTWTRALWRVNQWLFLRHLRIQVSLPPADLARLQALPAQGAMIIASNHPSYPDPLVLFELCRRWDRPAYFVAARILFRRLWGFEGALISRAGAFSVAPGGRNQAAVDYARDRLRDGTHPLIIFPEGHTFYLNDIIMPLKPGAADWALELAREGRPACVVPIAIKYHYQQDVRGALNRGTQRMERLVLHGAPELPPGDFWSRLYLRLYRIGDTVLSRYEERYGYRPPRGADVDERLVGLADFLIRDLERKYEREAGYGSTIFDRARHLMAVLEEDTNPEHFADAAEARFAWHLSTFTAGYLRPDSSPERFAETVLKLTRELFDQVPFGIPLRREARVSVGDVLDARAYLDLPPEMARHRLLDDLAHRLQAGVDGLQERR